MVTGVPGAQKFPDVAVRGPLRTNDVSPPAGRLDAGAASKVRGPLAAVRTDHDRLPPEVTGQAEEQVTPPVPVLVPAKTTWHEVAVEQEMGDPPLFLRATEMATGESEAAAPALRDAPTTTMLEFAVALLMRL